MRRILIVACASALLISSLLIARKLPAQQSLRVEYGSQGVQQLSYGGVVLEDLGAFSPDAFHIWHMQVTDLEGNVLSQGQYGWGENNNGKQWNALAHTWTYTFSWGSIATAFSQSGDSLNIRITVTNLADSGVIFHGATVYPLTLHFPRNPSGFPIPAAAVLSSNTESPSVTIADFGSGEVALVDPDAGRPLYTGFVPSGATNAYAPIVSGTTPDGTSTFAVQVDRPVRPGETDTQSVSLRFAPAGTSAAAIAPDVYTAWGAAWPPQLHWSDRRIVGTVYLASSPTGNPSAPGGYPNNPRRYFNDSNAADFDITTAAGLVAFQTRILAQASANVQNLRRLNAQGAITWDIEGEQYPQATSYVCSPDQIAQVAPEMETVVRVPGSPYTGMKLDDAYFKTMRDAGFRVGVCVRPQQFTKSPGGSAIQMSLSTGEAEALLLKKMQYAHSRWGATLFYVDSSVDAHGAALPAAIFQHLAAEFPDSLLIPEESTPKDYAYVAPFLSFLFHSDLETDPSVRAYYPNAFSVNLVNDVDPQKLAQFTPQLTDAVAHGDILMVHADYWQANNSVVMQIYQAAAAQK